jgi:hypothetical protein
MVAFAGFVVVPQHATAIDHEGKPIFELVRDPGSTRGKCQITNSANDRSSTG